MRWPSQKVLGIRETRRQLVEQQKAYMEAPARDWFAARIADCDAMEQKLFDNEVAFRANKFSDWEPDPL